MNAKNYYLGLLLGCGMLVLSSCEKEVYNPDNTKKTTDLVVPEGFDWAMTRSVTLSMKSEVATSVSVYSDEKCERLLAELPVEIGENSIELNLPSANSYVWIKYPIKNGGEETRKISIKKVSTRAAAKWTAEVLFPDYATKNGSVDVENTLYQPNKNSFGTIMFEDMWPEIGDYDFNDFVVNYKSEITYHHPENTESIDNDRVCVDMTLKLRAMGGSLPYRFCIQIGGGGKTETHTSMNILRENVTLSNVSITNNEAIGGNVELLPEAESAIVALTGFEKLREKTSSTFYNTQQGYLVDNSATPVIKFTLEIKSDAMNKFKGFGAEYAFDYFLQNTNNGREIHFLDYPPTELYKTYDNDKKSNNTTYYCSDMQFVWALKAPVEMGWSVETKDIKFVYPDFSKWVVSGGNMLEGDSNWDSNNQWYNRPEKNGNYIDSQEH